VALLLADQRMPEMTGIELLRAAARIHPEAKRVLLSPDSDAEAAIQGINEVNLDYYLHKPWTPVEQRLYPVLDELLSDWPANCQAFFEGVRVVGSSWSAQCFETKEFLFRNNVPYQWIEIDRDAAMKTLCVSIAGDPPKLPVVLFPDGSHLVCPSTSELAEKVGIQTRPRLPAYDMVIVGGGPAGLAAAIYGASEGLRTLLIERSAIGGQAGSSPRIENYLGFPAGISGVELARSGHRPGRQVRRTKPAIRSIKCLIEPGREQRRRREEGGSQPGARARRLQPDRTAWFRRTPHA
jgi:thioredoxin reductase (NADPH)